MVQAISGISQYSQHSDPEYLKIIQELQQLGIAPSGNKSTDKSKLQEAKIELVQKIQVKQEEEQKQELQVQTIGGVQDSQRTQMENERIGAMTVAELNKIYFGLL